MLIVRIGLKDRVVFQASEDFIPRMEIAEYMLRILDMMLEKGEGIHLSSLSDTGNTRLEIWRY